MSTAIAFNAATESQAILEASREAARQQGLLYAGDLTPEEALHLFAHGNALLVDVRTSEERQAVGYVPDAPHVPWATGTALERNLNFIRELERIAGKLDAILFLCRSSRRSVVAAEAASRLGFKYVFNVIEGFEGQPGLRNGWRARGLPWKKD